MWVSELCGATLFKFGAFSSATVMGSRARWDLDYDGNCNADAFVFGVPQM